VYTFFPSFKLRIWGLLTLYVLSCSKIVELEEELRVVGNNLKSLEVSEEKVRRLWHYLIWKVAVGWFVICNSSAQKYKRIYLEWLLIKVYWADTSLLQLSWNCQVGVQVFFNFETLRETVSSMIILYALYYEIFCGMVRLCACRSSSRVVRVFCWLL